MIFIGGSESYQRIAEDYPQAHKAWQTTPVASPGNDERRNLNSEIRTLLVARGHVDKQDREQQILLQRDLTPLKSPGPAATRSVMSCSLRDTRPQQRQGLNKNG
jgi:hypothetical protein